MSLRFEVAGFSLQEMDVCTFQDDNNLRWLIRTSVILQTLPQNSVANASKSVIFLPLETDDIFRLCCRLVCIIYIYL